MSMEHSPGGTEPPPRRGPSVDLDPTGIVTGKSLPEIAKELYLGLTTVKTHVQHLYEKLDVSDRAAAVATAMRRGLIE